jgi:alkylated DNA repair protein (DNA oxidative demethylase)
LTADLFETIPDVRPSREAMAEGAVLLRGFARPFEAELLPALRAIVKQAPFRHLITPGGHRMSVAMTNCGSVGWVSDSTGYRYDAVDPESGQPWPAMPTVLRRLAADAAMDAGFNGFRAGSLPHQPLCSRARSSSLHQDKDELDFAAPIVSVSLGLPAIFLFGGPKRADKPNRYRLEHGDVVVWGGPSRTVLSRRRAARRGRTRLSWAGSGSI